MAAVSVAGQVDEKHRLFAVVPDSIPAGPVTVVILPTVLEDDAGDAWTDGVAEAWSGELGDVRQDIYTLADGEPVRES